MTNDQTDTPRDDLTHLIDDDLEPGGFQRITRTRPPKRPISSDRERGDTRRKPREGKW